MLVSYTLQLLHGLWCLATRESKWQFIGPLIHFLSCSNHIAHMLTDSGRVWYVWSSPARLTHTLKAFSSHYTSVIHSFRACCSLAVTPHTFLNTCSDREDEVFRQDEDSSPEAEEQYHWGEEWRRFKFAFTAWKKDRKQNI